VLIEVSDESPGADPPPRVPAPASPSRFQSFTLQKADLCCLSQGACLTDAIVNAYLAVLSDRSPFSSEVGFTDTFFMNKLRRDGSEAANGWAGINGVRLDTYRQFLVPVHTGSHWILLNVDFDYPVVNILDSMGKGGRKFGDSFIKFMKIQNILTKFFIRFPQVPRQRNNHDCGVFLLLCAKCIFEKIPLDQSSFGQAEATAFRNTIREELCAQLTSP
jgi:Ulp1 family protease